MSKRKPDFAGWVTKTDVQCSDGLIIRQGAFKHNDGMTVPLVWNHQYNSPENVLGYVKLQDLNGGTYGRGYFNDTESANTAKKLLAHGDITSMSIFANKLRKKGPNVVHGDIKEVSLVLANANPGATIEEVMVHGDFIEDAAIIYTGYNFDDDDLSHGDNFDDYEFDDELYHNDDEDEDSKKKSSSKNGSKTVQQIYNEMSEEQKAAVHAIAGAIVSQQDEDNDDEGDDEMKHNAFSSRTKEPQSDTLTHDEMVSILADAKRLGSLREAFIQHGDGDDESYGITNIDYLFPDYKNLNTPPEFIKRDMDWVPVVMNGVHHTPFSRIKSMFADITEDEARAKGYIKGNRKKDEIFSLLKRTTDPQTIYKKQKLDRDDVIDITDFDVIVWLKAEMRMMLDEEIARAVLVGDGRPASSEDKISEDHVRSIYNDDELYSVKVRVEIPARDGSIATDDKRAKAIIRGVIKAFKEYKGSGQPKLFTSTDWVTDMLLLEDGVGRQIYDTTDKLRTALRVSAIHEVPVMENLKRTVTLEGGGTEERILVGIIVNLNDYNVGADKGGAVNMFDDFDIDYNQMKYLIETRCSGALIRPYSALVIEAVEVSNG